MRFKDDCNVMGGEELRRGGAGGADAWDWWGGVGQFTCVHTHKKRANTMR